MIDYNSFPKKGDRIELPDGTGKKETGTVLDDNFDEVQWDNGDIEQWAGMWGTALEMGGKILKQK